ncbi:LacI family DNA-binding transcriptional regulator [Acidocella aminolytica]|uniref:Transcriptional regulator LacI n=1 Tax=Acidocella aminolytica 101 = DSM 11237 TaxID=1120923 RepID=A0A0D6PHC2_9PROT|nr:LacI family DNA-binding transcriptional regulator [Acidocella aminolytica]GAN80771.1 transcriptional regulator LacI [Acidocella aminolytica 101 = DSM 11237]GBQ36526.1 transcriptional regulator [Acidocella aminolytica 101 = DSM 11237]SHF51859.1 transcriptional regulator, LacI family [Acidocella aminolytica 101 = DSM 11237]
MNVLQRPTLHDVAARAGVSIATVSRVLNGTGIIRPATEAKVREAIRQLGFRPNRMGRDLRMGQSRSIGVLLPTLANPIFADSVAGIQEAARNAGWTVLITSSDYDTGHEQTAVEGLLSERVAGLIITVTNADTSQVLNSLDNELVPYVLFHNETGNPARSCVAVDNARAGYDAAQTLISHGHQRLGMVAGQFAASDRSRSRHAGFTVAVRAAGLPQPDLIEIDFNSDIACGALRAAFLTPLRPTGIFCSNDLLALRTIAGLRELGLAVPYDVSVIGMDGINVGQLIAPSLASIVQPSREMGRQAFAHLLARIAGDAEPEQIRVPHSYRPGQSLSAAKLQE